MGDELDEMTESMSGAMSLDGDVEKLESFYDDWATDYDADVASHGYGMPEMVCRTLVTGLEARGLDASRADLRVLDAGCGTGLVGVELHGAGFADLHGVDLSSEMIEVARTRGIYRSLEAGVDLTVPAPPHLAAAADAMAIGGVFTVGHIPPEALETCMTYLRPGGVLAVSVRAAYLDETAFRSTVERLVDAGRLEQVARFTEAPYTMDSTGEYWAWVVQ